MPDGTASRQIGVLENLLSQTLESLFITHGALRMHADSTQHGDIETVRTSLPLWATAHEDDLPNELLIVSLSFRLSFWAGRFLPKFAEQTALRQSPISHMLGASGGANMMAGILGHEQKAAKRETLQASSATS